MLKQVWYDFLNWMDGTTIWQLFCRTVMAHLNFRFWGYPKFDFEQIEYIKTQLELKSFQQGCLVFTSCDTKSFGSLMIRTFTRKGNQKVNYTHGGIVIPGEKSVAHMKSAGLLHQNILTILRETDNFCLRWIPLNAEQYEIYKERLETSLKHAAIFRYDYSQELNNGDYLLYCSEYPRWLLRGLVELDPDSVLGRDSYSPHKLSTAGEPVFEFLVN